MNVIIMFDAITKIDDRLIDRCLIAVKANREDPESDTAYRKNAVSRKAISIIAALGVLTAVLLPVLIFQVFLHNDSFELPTDVDSIVWASKKDGNAEEVDEVLKWNNLKVSKSLYSVLKEKKQDEYIASFVRSDYSDIDSFPYEGKTYKDYTDELYALEVVWKKNNTFSKDAEYLKYGESLYKEGAPDGKKWSEERYNERVRYYGEEYISEYIADNEFDKQKFENDAAQVERSMSSLRSKIQEIQDAYRSDFYQTVFELLEKEKCSATIKGSSLFLFITPEQLSNLRAEDYEDCIFEAASRESFFFDQRISEPEISDISALTHKTTGYAVEKIKFDFDYSSVNSDEEINDAIAQMMKKWKYTYKSLSFTVYCDASISDDDFEDMNYYSIVQLEYPRRYVIEVEFKNINTEAIKVLSQNEAISSIHISVPLNLNTNPDTENE